MKANFSSREVEVSALTCSKYFPTAPTVSLNRQEKLEPVPPVTPAVVSAGQHRFNSQPLIQAEEREAVQQQQRG